MNPNPRPVREILAEMNELDTYSHCDSPEDVGRRVKYLREMRGLSQRQLAFRGCSAAYVSRIEAGDRRASLQQLHRLAWRLQTTAAYLAHGKGPETAPPADSISYIAGTNRELERKMTDLSVEMRLALVRDGLL